MTRKNTELRQEPPPIRLFVYGTLKRDYWNFERYCRNAVDIQPATVWGRLYQLSAGYPAIEVPETSILAHGTDDPVADAITQKCLAETSCNWTRPEGDWNLVHGEIMTFLEPERDLPPIDRLEGFVAGGQGLYRRVMIIVNNQQHMAPAWLYCMVTPPSAPPSALRITSGKWDRQSA